jgi:hypothetical protein
MLYDVATRVNTSSNQAIKDPSQRQCSYSNLSKIVIQSVVAKRVAADVCGCAYYVPGRKIPVARHPPIRAKSGRVCSQ